MGKCVTITQNIFGRVQTTGMCYSDLLRAAYSGLDWIGLKVDCTTNSSAEGELYPFDNIPISTAGTTPPPPKTGYLQQTAGEAGARFDHMRATLDPVAWPTYRKIEESAKLKFRCCEGLLCNVGARPNGDVLLNYSSNVTALLSFQGFKSPRSSTDFLLYHAHEFREMVAAALKPQFPLVSSCHTLVACHVPPVHYMSHTCHQVHMQKDRI
jgi:hypothetical protein